MTSHEFIEWRKRVSLTQDAVADRFKISRSTIQNWESGATPISYLAEQMCTVWEHRLLQENGAAGPVTLTYADGPMWVDAYSPRRLAQLQLEPFRTNSLALGRVRELWGTPHFHNPFIMLEDDVLWNGVELGRMAADQDDDAPIPARWRGTVIRNIADYIRKVSMRYPVRRGARMWTPDETTAWKARVTAHLHALEVLAAEAAAATTPEAIAALRRRVEGVLTELREESVFPSHKTHHDFAVAYFPG